jgi:hypothetical protein
MSRECACIHVRSGWRRTMPGNAAALVGPARADCLTFAAVVRRYATNRAAVWKPWPCVAFAAAAADVDVAAQSLRCPPSLLRQVLRVRRGRPLARPMSYMAYGRSLVRNSPRGWAPKTLPDPEVRVGRARACGGTVGRHVGTPHEGTHARKVLGNLVAAPASAFSPWCSGNRRGRRRHNANSSPSTQPYRRERPWCPPSRRVPHKWSGRRPNRYMGRVSGLSFSNAEDLSEQRGWAPRSPRETPKCRQRRRNRAIRAARCEQSPLKRLPQGAGLVGKNVRCRAIHDAQKKPRTRVRGFHGIAVAAITPRSRRPKPARPSGPW